MPSLFALRTIVAATLGLGSLDLALVTLVLGPEVVHEAPQGEVAIVYVPPVIAPPPPVEVPALEPIEERVYFATDSAQLDARARSALAAVAAQVGEREVTLEGHADLRGPEAINLALSKQRASVVADELVKLGVSRARIDVRFVGATRSLAKEMWRDRRVDLRVGGSR